MAFTWFGHSPIRSINTRGSFMTTEELEDQIRSSFNRSRGRLAGLIESWGLDARRERAMITTMKSLSYDDENALIDKIKQQ